MQIARLQIHSWQIINPKLICGGENRICICLATENVMAVNVMCLHLLVAAQ